MTPSQWNTLLAVLRGELLSPPPVAFIMDSPWLPNWAGMTILDYFSSGERWFEANLKAMTEFPEAMFLPGFWAEFGMCTEPSAFGARCVFPENEFPHAAKIVRSVEDIDRLSPPDPRTDGLLPFVIKRLQHYRPRIEAAGHSIRFAVSRGPLNVASFLMGIPEFLMEIKCNPEKIHQLLRLTTAFIADWIAYQRECFPTIDGVLLLDDIVGFLGEGDFKEFGLPYLKELYGKADVSVRFFHNDAPCRSSAPYLHEAGINLYNMGIESALNDVRQWIGPEVTLMGNIPPLDVLAAGSPRDVADAVAQQFASLSDRRRILFSCGGGLPPGVSTENLRAFLWAVTEARV